MENSWNAIEVTPNLKWSETCAICEANRAITFAITSAKPCVPVVTLSSQDNAKLLQQLKSGFKRTINRNKYQQKTCKYDAKNWYLDKLISPSFQWVNRIIVLSFKNENDRLGHTEYYLLRVELKDYSVKIDGGNFFDQPTNDDTKTWKH